MKKHSIVKRNGKATGPWAKRKVKPRSQWKQQKRPGGGYLHTEKEIALELGESERTIRSLRLSGVIPALVLGHRTIRFRLPAVIAALEKRTVKAR